ncbi:GNAT family N-acetyltransferase [Paenibacillus sp. FSL H8-0548]|uniref:GNAT family N-acetyltransferase n=1 Tax=Paenibacillus sp. FSL H8-0548 TaxID=1920422 RepID=UPI00096DC1AA|nr:GNAT family protein [Paenibacillus sp. FSL H8-0548]OMF24157.1 GNAT family N-acetyltransferase [Paenibacillus sp. FSL H8-0548]
MDLETLTLEGERVKLIPLNHNHVEQLYDAVDSAEVWTFLPSRMDSVEDMNKLVEGALHGRGQGTEIPFVVIDKETNEIVGMTRLLNLSLENRSLEIGWTWYSSKVWRSRVNTECKFLLLSYCFETLHILRVQIKADSRNNRSNQAILRIGAQKEGVLRKERVLFDGYIRDAVIYSILDDEWAEVKTRLIGLLK